MPTLPDRPKVSRCLAGIRAHAGTPFNVEDFRAFVISLRAMRWRCLERASQLPPELVRSLSFCHARDLLELEATYEQALVILSRDTKRPAGEDDIQNDPLQEAESKHIDALIQLESAFKDGRSFHQR